MGQKSGKFSWNRFCFVICLLLAITLTACTDHPPTSNDPDSSGSKYGGTVKMIILDPVLNLGFQAEQRVTGYLYQTSPVLESLGRYGPDGQMVPLLAESWESDPDAKTITFVLRKGVKFHDNTDFNAEAAKWNIEQFIEAKRSEVAGIRSIETVDEHTIRIHLEEWDNTLLDAVAYFVRMVSPTAVKEHDVEWAIRNPIGTGPFTFVSWDRDVSVKFKKNENYWQAGKPYLDGIEYMLIPDRNTSANVFKTGGGDVLTLMNPEVYQELEATGKYTSWTNDGVFGALGMGLMFDSANSASPFADLKVRQAVMHAVDQEAIIQSVFRGFGTATNQWNISSLWSYNPEVQGYKYDPERAKQLLAEAGYASGFKTQIITDPPRANLITAVQSYLAKVGIDAQLVTVDTAKWNAMVGDRWDGLIYYPMSLGPNTVTQMTRVFGQSSAIYAKNIIHPDKVEQLLEEARSAPDFEASKKVVHELQKTLFDEYAVSFPILRLKAGVVMDPKVQDLDMWKSNGLDWSPENVWLQK